MPSNAKELLLKDAEYSTPQDHYFAHIQSKKTVDTSEEEMEREREAAVMKILFDDEDDALAVDIAV